MAHVRAGDNRCGYPLILLYDNGLKEMPKIFHVRDSINKGGWMMFKTNIFSQRKAAVVLAVFLLSLPALATGATYHVDAGSGADTGDCSTACKTITYAAAHVPAGTSGAANVIMVVPGLYDNTNNGEVFPIAFNNDYVSLTVASLGTTTIDAEWAGTALDVNAMDFSVSGFTFDNAKDYAIDFDQGGFTVSNNIFTSNVKYGVYYYESTSDLTTDYTVGNVSITNNTFNASEYGAYLYAYLDYDEFTAGLTATLGTVNVSNNTFTGCTYGVYMEDYYISGMYNGTATIGDQTYDTNTFTNCSYGIYFDDYYIEYMYGASTASLGNVLINNNTCDNCSSYGIYIYGMWLEYFYNSTGTMGNLTVTNNTVKNGGTTTGIYLYYYYLEYLYDNSTATAGNVTFSGNTISGCSSYGIYVDDYYINEIYSSTATMGNVVVDNNKVTGGSYGIYLDDFYIEYLYGSNGTIGNLTVSNNTLKGQTSYGYYQYYWGAQWYIYGPSKGTVGNMTVSGNTITTDASSGYGMYLYEMYYIYDLEGTSVSTQGTMEITNNTVTSYSEALYFSYYYTGSYLGDYSYDATQVTTGATSITGNKFTSTNSYGTYIYYYCVGYDIYGTSKIYMGASNISGNTIKGNSEGLYLYFDYNAYNMYDRSMLDWKPITIHNNTINSETSDAVYIEWYYAENGSYNYDYSRAKLPDLIFTGNTVDTKSGDGFYYYNYENPYYNEDHAYVDFGSMLFDGNTFNPNKDAGMSDGINIYIYETANENYDHSTTVWGDTTITNNKIYNVSDEAIYLDYDGFPYEIIDYHSFIGGNFNISNNMIAGADYGIDLEFDYLETDEFGTVTVGTFNVADNTLTDITSDGIYVVMDAYNTIPATAKLTVGATTIKDNMITADAGGGSSGIYFDGDIQYDDVTFGMPVLSGNTISGFIDGIELYGDTSYGGLDEMSLSCNWLQNNTSNGLRFDTEGKNFTVLNNAITGNTAFGLSVDDGNAAVINAEKNWWGDKLGPAACVSCNGVDPGDSGTVDFDPWLSAEPTSQCAGAFSWPMFVPAITGAGIR
jgi:Right handed beta helix region